MTDQAERVLIVEIGGRQPHQIESILADAGFETSTASDIEAIEAALAAWHPSVIVVDLPLHDHRGGELLADLARHVGDRVPLILSAEGSNLLKPAPVIPFGLVPRPVDPEQLVSMVSRAVRGRVRA